MDIRNVYTLRHPMTGEREVLNGKLLVVKKNGNHPWFFDLCTRKCIWQCTSLVNKEDTPDGVIITTSSGSSYDLMSVAMLIPTIGDTGVNISDQTLDNFAKEPPKVVNDVVSHKHIHYGDGYTKHEIEFDREITVEEFILYCNANGLNTRTVQEHPYQDYAKLEGSGKHWIHTWVNCYTD